MKRIKSITAGKWVYTLKAGKLLRAAIASDDAEDTIQQLKSCWREINEKFPEDFDEHDLDEVLEDLDIERDNLRNYEDYDMTYEDVEDDINYYLGDLYDFCDTHNIWIGKI